MRLSRSVVRVGNLLHAALRIVRKLGRSIGTELLLEGRSMVGSAEGKVYRSAIAGERPIDQVLRPLGVFLRGLRRLGEKRFQTGVMRIILEFD